MNIIEKRDYIHNHLSLANEQLIDELFKKLSSIFEKDTVLKSRLISRAKKSEENICCGKVFSREDIEGLFNHISR